MSQPANANTFEFRLRIERPNQTDLEKTLENGRSVFIGSGDSCGIQVTGDGVAEIHCLLDVDGDQVSVQDWASDAGTKVNGQVIDDKTPLNAGDSIELGCVTIRFESSSVAFSTEKKQEPLEEAVGMEHLGYETEELETSEPEPEVEPTEPAASQPIVAAPAGRLSDSFSSASAIHAGIDQADEHLNDQALEESLSDPISDDPSAFGDDPAEEESEPTFEDTDDSQLDSVSVDGGWGDPFAANNLSSEDLDWDPDAIEDEEVDAEIVQLLKSEIEDLRIQIAERDEQIAAMSGLNDVPIENDEQHASGDGSGVDNEFGSGDLVSRVDDLLAELEEHDERVSTLQELLETAEIQNQAEREERNCLETWVGEIEQRIGDRESEWQAEQDSLRQRLTDVADERDHIQKQLHAATQRYGNPDQDTAVVQDDVVEGLQKQNAELQTQLDESRRQCAQLAKQLERSETAEPESLQETRAELAQEKAAVSRMRFQLSKQLQDLEDVPEAKDQPDREFAYKLQTLREHLREIHEEEKTERDRKGDSLLGRISSLWKRVDDEY